MSSLLTSDDLPEDVAGAESLLSSHAEHKVEIDARQASFTAFKTKGESLINARHYASKEVTILIYMINHKVEMNYILI